MTRRILFTLAFLGASITAAHARSYTVTLFQPATVSGTELKPGDYTVEVKDETVTIKNAKTQVSAPVKVETAETKNSSTTVRYANGDGKYKIQEIRLGGTKTKLVLQEHGDTKAGGF